VAKTTERSESAAFAPPGFARVAPAERLRGAGPHGVSADGTDVVLVRTSAGLRAFEGRCPHQGALLAEGELDNGYLICSNHGWRFNLETGRRAGGPGRLASCPVIERDGEVFVDVTSVSDGTLRTAGSTRSLSEVPGPPGIPLLGNLHQIRLTSMHRTLEGWAAMYGPLYSFRMGPKRMVVVSDAELAHQVLRARPSTYRRLARIEEFGSDIGLPGVFSAEGAAWQQQRRLWTDALGSGRVRNSYPILKTVVDRLRERLNDAAQRGGPIDIVSEFKRFTADTTTFLALGYDLNSLGETDDIVQRHLDTIFRVITRRSLALIPTWRFIRLPSDRECERALVYMRKWVAELVTDTRARFAADPASAERPVTLLESFVAARDENGRPFSNEVILGNMLDALLAGEETTAYTLGWAVHILCDSPAPVAALRAEAEAVLGSSTAPDDYEAVRRLAYTGAVVSETLRLRPTGPLLVPNETATDTVLSNVSLPAGTPVLVLARPPTVDRENFAEPEAFRPERWLTRAQGAHNPSAFMPFGTGPRVCPGRSFGLLSAKVVLAMLYRYFEVERVGRSEQVSEHLEIAMEPAGLRVALRPRDSSSS